MIIVCLFVFQKIVKKLAGAASVTASWCTNVGYEHGQVVMSVLTDNEGDDLDDMAEGLMQRYIGANIPPPKVLYVDRDCCSKIQDPSNSFTGSQRYW